MNDEITPARAQTPMDLIFSELAVMRGICEKTFTYAQTTDAAVRGLVDRMGAAERRLDAKDAVYVWVPLIVSAVSLVGMLYTLSLVIGHG